MLRSRTEKKSVPEAVLRFGVKQGLPVRDFPAALTRDAINVIAELKRRRLPWIDPCRFSTCGAGKRLRGCRSGGAVSADRRGIFSGRIEVHAGRARGRWIAGAAQGFHRRSLAGMERVPRMQIRFC